MSSYRIWQLSARKLTQDATLEELRELEQLLLANPELASQLEMHSHFFNSGHETPSAQDAEMQNAWMRQLQAMNEAAPDIFTAPDKKVVFRRIKKKKLSWFAAVLAVVVLLISYAIVQRVPGKEQTTRHIGDITIKAGDSRHEVTLPDGTKATLNRNSYVVLGKGFGKTNRNLSLEGEVFFDVVHDEQMPFRVQAASILVKVLGTAFNVRSYKDEHLVQTSLIRGSVEITDKINKNFRIRLKPNEKVSIQVQDIFNNSTPEESEVLFKKESLHKEEVTGIIPETAWMQDKLMFNGEPLGEVAKKLEKWYKVSIVIDNPELKEERFTGVFDKETIGEALKALQITYPFHYTITGTTVTLK